MISLLTVLLFVQTWSFSDYAIAAVVIIGIFGILFVVLRASGVPVPPWFWSIVAIVALCFVAIIGIRLLASM